MSVQSIGNGTYFDLDNMDQNTIDIETVARSLSRINRFLGHTEVPYSVAQHSVLVSELVQSDDPNVQLAALMHDAHECITGDITTPVKHYLRRSKKWIALEERLKIYFADTFGFDYATSHGPLVKQADQEALWLERQWYHQSFADAHWNGDPQGERRAELAAYDARVAMPSIYATVYFMRRYKYLVNQIKVKESHAA